MKYHFDNELVIREVEKYRYIYDCNYNDFCNQPMKKQVWMTVAKNVVGKAWDQMDETTKSDVGNEVQKRWKHLKDTFLRSLKKEMGQSAEERQFKKPYVYHKQMNFLRSVYEQRENFDQASTDNSTSMEHEAVQGQDNVTWNVKEKCEKNLSESSPSNTEHHLGVLDDETTKVIPAKRLMAHHISSTESCILRKILQSSTLKNAHDVTGNAEEDFEARLCDSSPSSTMHHQIIFNNGITHPVPVNQLKTGNFSATENINLQKRLLSSERKTVHDVTGNAEEDFEVRLCNSRPSSTMYHQIIFNNGIIHPVPAKQLKTGNFSSTENISLLKRVLSSEHKTIHDVIGNAEKECEVRQCDSSPSSTKYHQSIFNNGITHSIPAKQVKTGHFSVTENINFQKRSLSSETKTVSEDSNELFLRSLLHDMSKLNPGKLRHFKAFVITKLTNLLDEQDAETVTRDLTAGLENPFL